MKYRHIIFFVSFFLLISVNSRAQKINISFQYDANGNRIGRTVDKSKEATTDSLFNTGNKNIASDCSNNGADKTNLATTAVTSAIINIIT